MKKITRNVFAVIAVGVISLTANAQARPQKVKIKPAKHIAITQATASVAATTYLSIGSIIQLPCSTNFEVNFTVSNPGEAALTAATINYEINGIPGTYQWEGSLAAGAEETITFTVPNTATGEQNLSATLAALNGSSEGIPAESYTQTFTVNTPLTTVAPSVTVRIQPDDFPDEISWELKTSAGAVVAEGGDYNSDPEIVGTIVVPVQVNADECYTFTIYDSFHDGICCSDNGQGYYQIVNLNNEVIHTGGQYADSDSISFSVTAPPAGVKDYSVSTIKLYPNPANGYINLEIPAASALPEAYVIYNSLGQAVGNGAVTGYTQQISTANFAGGMYFIRLNSADADTTLQFIKG